MGRFCRMLILLRRMLILKTSPHLQMVSLRRTETTKCAVTEHHPHQQMCWSTKWVDRPDCSFWPHFTFLVAPTSTKWGTGPIWWYYQCARKHEGRGKGKGQSCSAQAIIDVNPLHEEIVLVKAPNLTDHNHICDEARIVKWKMMNEMQRRVMTNLATRAAIIRKAVVFEYQDKYKDDPSTWSEAQLFEKASRRNIKLTHGTFNMHWNFGSDLQCTT